MATLLGQLLRGSTLAYNRPDVLVMDSSSTSLPVAGPTAPTVDGTVMTVGSRALYTALTTAGQPNNWTYVLTVTYASGSPLYSMAPAHDSRSPNQTGAATFSPSGSTLAIGGGAPQALDMIYVDQGSTNAGKLMCYSGTAWVDTASL